MKTPGRRQPQGWTCWKKINLVEAPAGLVHVKEANGRDEIEILDCDLAAASPFY